MILNNVIRGTHIILLTFVWFFTDLPTRPPISDQNEATILPQQPSRSSVIKPEQRDISRTPQNTENQVRNEERIDTISNFWIDPHINPIQTNTGRSEIQVNNSKLPTGTGTDSIKEGTEQMSTTSQRGEDIHPVSNQQSSSASHIKEGSQTVIRHLDAETQTGHKTTRQPTTTHQIEQPATTTLVDVMLLTSVSPVDAGQPTATAPAETGQPQTVVYSTDTTMPVEAGKPTVTTPEHTRQPMTTQSVNASHLTISQIDARQLHTASPIYVETSTTASPVDIGQPMSTHSVDARPPTASSPTDAGQPTAESQVDAGKLTGVNPVEPGQNSTLVGDSRPQIVEGGPLEQFSIKQSAVIQNDAKLASATQQTTTNDASYFTTLTPTYTQAPAIVANESAAVSQRKEKTTDLKQDLQNELSNSGIQNSFNAAHSAVYEAIISKHTQSDNASAPTVQPMYSPIVDELLQEASTVESGQRTTPYKSESTTSGEQNILIFVFSLSL